MERIGSAAQNLSNAVGYIKSEPTILETDIRRISMKRIDRDSVQYLRRLNAAIFPLSYRDSYYRDAIKPESISWSICYGDEYAGSICCRQEIDSGTGKLYYYVMTMGVLAVYRRLGLGTLLLNTAEKEARATGASHLALHVQINNSIALEFYRRHGFQIDKIVDRYYNKIEPSSAYLLILRLDNG